MSPRQRRATKKLAIVITAALALHAAASVRPIDPKTRMPEAPVHYWVADGLWVGESETGWHEYARTVHFGVWKSEAGCRKWVQKQERETSNRSWECQPVYEVNEGRKAR